MTYRWIPILVLIIAGCDLIEADEELNELLPPETVLIPLAVGNYWVYDQWQVEPTWRDTVRNEVLTVRDVVIENTKIRAYGTHRFRFDDRPRTDALISLSTNGPEGHYGLGFEAPFDTLNKLSSGLRFKFPANTGDRWEYTVVAFNIAEQQLRIGNTRTIELIDTTKTVETLVGTFENCYTYVFNDFRTASLLYHHMHIKPEVGLVGVDTYEADNPYDTNVLYGQQRLIELSLKNSI